MNWDQEVRHSDEGDSQPYADLKPCAGCGDDVDIDGPDECATCAGEAS